MDGPDFYLDYLTVIAEIDRCLEKNLNTPALILIFTTIDTVGWLASGEPVPSNPQRFEAFVNDWMLKNYPLPCTAKELYKARCGLLHTLIPSSGPYDKTGERELIYTWTPIQERDWENKIKLDGKSSVYVATQVRDIWGSLLRGFGAFYESLETNPSQKALFDQRATEHYDYLDELT